MRSCEWLTDSMFGLIVATAMVCAVGWAAVVIDRHAEQHGHGAPLALIDVERTQRSELHAGGQGVGGCGGHASFFATGGVSDAVRRCGIESDRGSR